MIRVKTTSLVVILMVLATFAVGIAAEAGLMKNEQKDAQNDIPQQSLFDAEITFYVLTGEGCACEPIPGAEIFAIGGEGSDSNVTDEDGMCVLTLVILSEYDVFIEADDYQEIHFEFNVLDDQTFTFHMFEKEETSAHAVPLLQRLITKILSR
jgi:hypothetical protein